MSAEPANKEAPNADPSPSQAENQPGGSRVRGDAETAAESQAAPAQQRNRRRGDGPRTSSYRGVQWDKNGQRWRARLYTDKTRHIGYYTTEEEAARAWDLAMLKSFGLGKEHKLNFPEESLAAYKEEQEQVAAALEGAANADPPQTREEASALASKFRGVIAVDGGKFKSVFQQGNKRKAIPIGELFHETFLLSFIFLSYLCAYINFLFLSARRRFQYSRGSSTCLRSCHYQIQRPRCNHQLPSHRLR